MKYLICTYCGKPVDEEFPKCCGEVGHTEEYDDGEPENTHQGPDYRTAEQWHADQAWAKRRRRMSGE